MVQSQKPSTASIPGLKAAGVEHVVGAAELGVGLQVSGLITLSDSSHPVVWAELTSQSGGEFKAPLDADYVAFITGDSAGLVDLESISIDGFNIVGGTGGDVVAIALLARFDAMQR